MVTLPTSVPAPALGNVSIVPNVPIGQAGLSNLQILQAAVQQGHLSADDVMTKLAQNPYGPAEDQAKSKAQIEDLKTLPIRRQQEIDAAAQARQLGDLQIQSAGEQLKDIRNPLRPAQRQAVQELLKEHFTYLPGEPLPVGDQGNVDLGQARQNVLAAKMAIQQQTDRLAAAKVVDENKNKLYTQHINAALPMRKDGTVDTAARDAALINFGPETQMDSGALDHIEANDSAQNTINQLEQTLAHPPKAQSTRGKISEGISEVLPPMPGIQGAREFIGSGADVAAEQVGSERDALVAQIGRGIYGTGRTLDPKEKAKIEKLLPSFNDEPDAKASKLMQVRQRLAEARAAVLATQKAAGRNTVRFAQPPPAETTTTGAGPAPIQTPPPAAAQARPTRDQVKVGDAYWDPLQGKFKKRMN